MGNEQVTGVWSQADESRHFNLLELGVLRLATDHWRQPLQGQRLLVHTGSAPAAWAFTRQESHWAGSSPWWTARSFDLVVDIDLKVRAVHIPGVEDVPVDTLSRLGSPPLWSGCWNCSRSRLFVASSGLLMSTWSPSDLTTSSICMCLQCRTHRL